jgi:hypothetical protein
LLVLQLRGTFVISPKKPKHVSIEFRFQSEIIAMNVLGLCLLAQLGLAFGVAGLFWPEKFRPVFDVLLFPWAASYRAVRANSIVAIGLAILLFVRLLIAF